eukprot:5056498-Prymnesium_polylepis.1
MAIHQPADRLPDGERCVLAARYERQRPQSRLSTPDKPARSHGGGRFASSSPGPGPVRGCVSRFQSRVRTGPG